MTTEIHLICNKYVRDFAFDRYSIYSMFCIYFKIQTNTPSTRVQAHVTAICVSVVDITIFHSVFPHMYYIIFSIQYTHKHIHCICMGIKGSMAFVMMHIYTLLMHAHTGILSVKYISNNILIYNVRMLCKAKVKPTSELEH